MALKTKSFAAASAAAAALFGVIDYIWHGLLGQPTFITMTPGFWSDYGLMLYAFVGAVVVAYIVGYAFAWTYNKHEKK